MHATRPATGIGHARGMKPICVEHRRACNFASLSFPCFVDSLRTRACMHACMHAVATVVIRFAWRGRIRCFWISLFFFSFQRFILVYRVEKKGGKVSSRRKSFDLSGL